MTALIDRALRSAGLGEVLEARRAGPLLPYVVDRLKGADLLALGALADCVRRDEVGEEVRIYIGEFSIEPSMTILPEGDVIFTGLDLLRQVAISRVTGISGARVRINWTRCGMELAQVALGFGANELAGQITSKAGLPIAADDLLGVGKKSRRESARVVKERELVDCVRRAGRVPVLVGPDGASQVSPSRHVQEAV